MVDHQMPSGAPEQCIFGHNSSDGPMVVPRFPPCSCIPSVPSASQGAPRGCDSLPTITKFDPSITQDNFSFFPPRTESNGRSFEADPVFGPQTRPTHQHNFWDDETRQEEHVDGYGFYPIHHCDEFPKPLEHTRAPKRVSVASTDVSAAFNLTPGPSPSNVPPNESSREGDSFSSKPRVAEPNPETETKKQLLEDVGARKRKEDLAESPPKKLKPMTPSPDDNKLPAKPRRKSFTAKQDERWQEHYEYALEFVRREGHGYIPTYYKKNPKLAQWAKRQVRTAPS